MSELIRDPYDRGIADRADGPGPVDHDAAMEVLAARFAEQDAAGRPDMREQAVASGEGEKRVVLVHLNVEVPASDTRSADEVADAILAALEVGSDDDRVRDLVVVSPLAEEV